jgi:hypothetical protein
MDEESRTGEPSLKPSWKAIPRALVALAAKFGRFKKNGMKREYDLVAGSGLFDEKFYLSRNTDVADSGADPLAHYLRQGWRERRNPNPLFDTHWYLETYPDVAQSGVNPLVHYLRFGGFAGRDPSPRFDSSWYLEEYADVREGRINPLAHYLGFGQFEGRVARRPGSGLAGGSGVLAPYESWLAVNHLSKRDIAELRSRLDERSGKLPKMSDITPVYNTKSSQLEEAI